MRTIEVGPFLASEFPSGWRVHAGIRLLADQCTINDTVMALLGNCMRIFEQQGQSYDDACNSATTLVKVGLDRSGINLDSWDQLDEGERFKLVASAGHWAGYSPKVQIEVQSTH